MMKMAAVFACILFIAGLFSCAPPGPEMEAPPGEAAIADYEPEIFDDAREAVSGLLGREEKTMLFFWATWCPHCVTAIPDINEFYSVHKEDIGFMSVNMREDAGRVESFMRSRGVKYPVALDSDGSLSGEYNIMGVPTYIVLDPADEIIHTGHALEQAKEAAGF